MRNVFKTMSLWVTSLYWTYRLKKVLNKDEEERKMAERFHASELKEASERVSDLTERISDTVNQHLKETRK